MPSGLREEREQDVKKAVKPTGSSYSWENSLNTTKGITLTPQFEEK